ncbi:MAG: ATP phosphoribosyltransferase regulatory subunit [Trueperaceae bacterium]|nr:ATP phosphoribosyltransferase regulatory subunit [Trueperaceae bacterium]
MFSAPEGTRFVLPPEARQRAQLVEKLQKLYDSWGYARVDTPMLEPYAPSHPRAEQSFKLSDRDSGVLSLRSDFTTALSAMVETYFSQEKEPMRFQYAGHLLLAIKNPDLARTREFTQLGLELIGVSNARADAELIHLARESVRAVGLTPRVELGNPGFVQVLFDLAEIPKSQQNSLADAIDRKDEATLESLLTTFSLPHDLYKVLKAVPDLYGGVDILAEAKKLTPWPEARAKLERIEAVLAEFEDDSELLIDLGMARRLSYYTGITFRAYTYDFGQPLLGGGRYDGALMPYAAGFGIGLERLLSALPQKGARTVAEVITLEDIPARALRNAGIWVERALSTDVSEVKAYAKKKGILYLLSEEGLEPLGDKTVPAEYLRLLEAQDG